MARYSSDKPIPATRLLFAHMFVLRQATATRALGGYILIQGG